MQARTIIDLKNMIIKQQKFIEDNDIIGSSTQDQSKYSFLANLTIDLELFLDEANDLDDQAIDDDESNTNQMNAESESNS